MQAQAVIKRTNDSHKQPKFADLLELTSQLQDSSIDHANVRSQEQARYGRRIQTEKYRRMLPNPGTKQRTWSLSDKGEDGEKDIGKEQNSQVPTTQKKKKVLHCSLNLIGLLLTYL